MWKGMSRRLRPHPYLRPEHFRTNQRERPVCALHDTSVPTLGPMVNQRLRRLVHPRAQSVMRAIVRSRIAVCAKDNAAKNSR